MTTLNNISKWKYDSNYVGEDYSEYYVVLTKHRDSDLIQESNFDCVQRDIEAGFIDSTEVIRLNHWAVGWVELLLIHESNLEALIEADRIVYKLESIYPIFDEDDYTQRVYDTACEIWDNAPEWEREEFCEAVGLTWDGTDIAPDSVIDHIITAWEL
jgi:hypothetical protein